MGYDRRGADFVGEGWNFSAEVLILKGEEGNTMKGSDDKVTVLESEKRAWESSLEAQAMKEALNPWRRLDEEKSKP
ncbi:hypothetical protein M5K25_000435 [Dendrobium thyrsiflorum]|uniref:Uncharacterized protein n=1 Tax=Dendrobium thyrsiflorum TaxID=117978 RepID=A0ABD0VTZ3_DENTH